MRSLRFLHTLCHTYSTLTLQRDGKGGKSTRLFSAIMRAQAVKTNGWTELLHTYGDNLHI